MFVNPSPFPCVRSNGPINKKTVSLQFLIPQAMKNLETYAHLICFNAFLHEHTNQRSREMGEEGATDTTTPTSADFVPFSKWMAGRPEIKAWMDKCRWGFGVFFLEKMP